jgi:hypothetical protein
MAWILIILGAGILMLALLAPKDPTAGLPPIFRPGQDDLQAGQKVCLAGIAREHDQALPSPLQPDEAVLWCHAVVNRTPGYQGKGPPRTKTLKAATWFRLSKEAESQTYVLVNGPALMPSLVSIDHDPERDPEQEPPAGHRANPLIELLDLFLDTARAMSSASVKVIRPGDRLWITGRLRQNERGLHLGRWARVDNVHPVRRRKRELAMARMTAFTFGPGLIIFGLWLMAG